MAERELTTEDVLANAVSFLVDGGEYEAAQAALACQELELARQFARQNGDVFHAILSGPRVLYDTIAAWERYANQREVWDDYDGLVIDPAAPRYDPMVELGEAIRRALDACTPTKVLVEWMKGVVAGPGAFPDWRAELAQAARQVVHNQAVGAERVHHWSNLRFRSQSEVRIARALSEAGVLFFANCLGRLPVAKEKMGNREPDFLVCSGGRWGILEVDGAPYHPPERAADDHDRDRLFRRLGLKVERYPADRCFEAPDKVVADFLQLLRQP